MRGAYRLEGHGQQGRVPFTNRGRLSNVVLARLVPMKRDADRSRRHKQKAPLGTGLSWDFPNAGDQIAAWLTSADILFRTLQTNAVSSVSRYNLIMTEARTRARR